ncbi:hypothetical protein EsH8_X_000563 [Colletotrichum jinshuiense]
MSGNNFLHIPYEERWEHLKPTIIDAYLGKNAFDQPRTLEKLAELMKNEYSFNAEARQYSYRLRKWDIKKRVPKEQKKDIVAVLGKRNHPSASTSDVTIRQGHGSVTKEVDKKQLKRFLNDCIRHEPNEFLRPGTFYQWNLPYAALRASLMGRQSDHASPFGGNPPTPQYLDINSPKAASPSCIREKPTPTAALILQTTLRDRSMLLLQGRSHELMAKCNDNDRRVLSGWLHDYWIHSFVTAKYWGRGPQEWTAGLVAEVTLSQPSVGTPQTFQSPGEFTSATSPGVSRPSLPGIPQPTHLCRWVIHHEDTVKWQSVETAAEPPTTQAEFELHDPTTWTLWPESEMQNRKLQRSMQEAFTRTRFSAISTDELPLSINLITEAISRSPKELELDSWAFCIMTGNMNPMIEKYYGPLCPPGLGEIGFEEIHPYHLAASFLDGGNSCCVVMNSLTGILSDFYPIALNYVDSNGHTVLDSLILSVLRSHTDLAPAEVSTSFNQCTRFPGEEKDICGRWDADSIAVRQLFKAGHPRIPHSWKHNFCHSSVQAVCHSMMAIFGPSSAPGINTLSGLFRRRCTATHCGLDMKLGPLHVVVVTAVYLAERGMDGETLFGAVAVLVCLLALGADVHLKADLSSANFLTSPVEDGCHHRPVNALEMAQEVPQTMVARWRPSCQLGWRCLLLVLRRALVNFAPESSGLQQVNLFAMPSAWTHDDFDDEYDPFGNESDEDDIRSTEEEIECNAWTAHRLLDVPHLHRDFGTLWAAIQTELLTYRKVTSLDPNISENFQLAALEKWLEGETDSFATPLIEDNMMNEPSSCGWFVNKNSIFSPTATDVSTRYFMNMDIWKRASFVGIEIPECCDEDFLDDWAGYLSS